VPFLASNPCQDVAIQLLLRSKNREDGAPTIKLIGKIGCLDSTSRHGVAFISADQPEWMVIELARLGRRLPRSKIGEASRGVGKSSAEVGARPILRRK